MDDTSASDLTTLEDDAPTQWFRRTPGAEAPAPRSSPLARAASFAVASTVESLLQELAGPLTFLGGVVRELAAGRPVDAAERSLALEEMQRIERLAVALRSFQGPSLDTQSCPVANLVGEVQRSVEADVAARGLRVIASVAPSMTVYGDEAALAFLLHAMVRAAVTRAVRGTDILVRAEPSLRDAKIEVQAVASSGTQVPDMRVPPWAPAAEDQLELLLARKVARAHGFRLRVDSYPDTHVLRLDVPHASVGSWMSA